MALLAGGAPAQLVRDIGTPGAVQGFLADGEIEGARLAAPLPFTAIFQAGDGSAQVTQTVLPPASSQFYIKVAGVWKTATAFIKVSGVWKVADPYIKDAGVWK